MFDVIPRTPERLGKWHCLDILNSTSVVLGVDGLPLLVFGCRVAHSYFDFNVREFKYTSIIWRGIKVTINDKI